MKAEATYKDWVLGAIPQLRSERAVRWRKELIRADDPDCREVADAEAYRRVEEIRYFAWTCPDPEIHAVAKAEIIRACDGKRGVLLNWALGQLQPQHAPISAAAPEPVKVSPAEQERQIIAELPPGAWVDRAAATVIDKACGRTANLLFWLIEQVNRDSSGSGKVSKKRVIQLARQNGIGGSAANLLKSINRFDGILWDCAGEFVYPRSLSGKRLDLVRIVNESLRKLSDQDRANLLAMIREIGTRMLWWDFSIPLKAFLYGVYLAKRRNPHAPISRAAIKSATLISPATQKRMQEATPIIPERCDFRVHWDHISLLTEKQIRYAIPRISIQTGDMFFDAQGPNKYLNVPKPIERQHSMVPRRRRARALRSLEEHLSDDPSAKMEANAGKARHRKMFFEPVKRNGKLISPNAQIHRYRQRHEDDDSPKFSYLGRDKRYGRHISELTPDGSQQKVFTDDRLPRKFADPIFTAMGGRSEVYAQAVNRVLRA